MLEEWPSLYVGYDWIHTIPGSRPPSATPSSARTVTNDAKFLTKPRHIVKTPHTAVNNGNQIFGDTFLSTRFDGSSLPMRQSITTTNVAAYSNQPRNIRGVKHTKPNRILMISDIDILLQTQNLCITDICAVDERAEEEHSKDW